MINTSSQTTSSFKLGDFNGDGKSDVFYANGSEWKVSFSGTSKWSIINTSGVTTGTLDLKNFNKDGKCDVFHATSSEWKVSWSGTSKWDAL